MLAKYLWNGKPPYVGNPHLTRTTQLAHSVGLTSTVRNYVGQV